ncbi:ABC transporter permease [Treponema pallidum]|nr:ABC transporter permease [Treponema pallidum]UZV88458.1 ABC transporter permease [Treponema pallidum]
MCALRCAGVCAGYGHTPSLHGDAHHVLPTPVPFLSGTPVAGKRRSFLRKSFFCAALGIGISIIPLIVVLVVSDGMIEGITTRMIELGSGHLQFIDILPLAPNETATQRYEDAQRIFNAFMAQDFGPYCHSRWMHLQGDGIVIGKTGRAGGNIRAVPPDFFSSERGLRPFLTVEGSLELVDRPQGVHTLILGKRIAERIGVRCGDTCQILTLVQGGTGRAVPKMVRAVVGGIVSCGYQELDALWVFIPLTLGMKILSPASALLSFVVKTADAFDAKAMTRFIEQVHEQLPSHFSAYTWQDMNRSQFHSFRTSRKLLLFIMYLIVLVASVHISSVLVVLMTERRKEIAMLKAMGAPPHVIALIFLSAGLLTALYGLLIGLPLGMWCAIHVNEMFLFAEQMLNSWRTAIHAIGQLFLRTSAHVPVTPIHLLDPAHYLERIPIVLSVHALCGVAGGTLCLSLAVCIIPALRAGRVRPLDLMRKV